MASIYNQVWEQLKANPDTSIHFAIPTAQHYTFRRMVQKLKWQDKVYKAAHRRARIFVSSDRTGITLRLVHNPI
jgi:predicted patatin/cPLA2 family phospholipase